MQRTDNALWTIPGGTMKPGETIAETAVREAKEETGIDVEVVTLIGIYSNPRHVVEYSDGEVRQQFSVCFACRPIGGEVATSDETSEVGYFSLGEIEVMEIHPSIRLRIWHYFEQARVGVPEKHGATPVGVETGLDTRSAVPLAAAYVAERHQSGDPLEHAREW